MAERTERGSIVLIQRNREIAEVREEMLQTDQRLDAAQTRNHVLLEETSVLDSTIFEHSGRAATAESQLAALFVQSRDREDELSQQLAANSRQAEALETEIAGRTEKMQRAEAEAASKKQSISALDGEIYRLQALLEAENTTIADVRRIRQEPFLGRSSQGAAETEALRAVEDGLQTVHVRHNAQREETIAARQGIDNLEAELAAERQRREDVSTSLRRAVVEQAEGSKRIRTAEATLAAQGGDAKAVLAKLRGASGGAVSSSATANACTERMAQLRTELKTSEDQCSYLKSSLDAQKAQDAEGASKISMQLDGARNELQQHIKEVADAHSSMVGKLEQEVQVERQRAANEEVEQRICMDQIAQLKVARTRARDERGCAIVRTQAEAGRCAALAEELLRVQGEVSSAEGRLVAIEERLASAEQRVRTAQNDGARRVAIIRSKIEALWQGLRVARSSSAISDPWPLGLR